MKATSTITDFVLVKADTNSDWDECQFALIHCTAEWRERMIQRLQSVQPFAEDYNFCSLNYYDTAVDFYRTNEDEQPDIHFLLDEKDWSFVELDEDEQDTFLLPESTLDTYRLRLYRGGTAIYTAFGKHTSEEFFTAEFSVLDIFNHHQQAVKIIQLY